MVLKNVHGTGPEKIIFLTRDPTSSETCFHKYSSLGLYPNIVKCVTHNTKENSGMKWVNEIIHDVC